MIHSMEPLLPTLQNLPVFYTVVISLLFMAGLSGYALYRRLRQRPPGPGFAGLKGLVLLPLWLLTLIWTGVAVYMGVIAGGHRRQSVIHAAQSGAGCRRFSC